MNKASASRLIWNSGLPAIQKYTLHAIVDATRNGCFDAPVKELADMTGLSDRALRTVLSALRDAKVLIVAEDAEHHTPTTYALDFAKLASSKSAELVIKERERLKQADEIYGFYPRKTGKPEAIRSILGALKKKPFEFIRDRTIQYAGAVAGTDTMLPNPSTWFNQERFNDDPSTWTYKRERQRDLSVSDLRLMQTTIQDELTALRNKTKYDATQEQRHKEAELVQKLKDVRARISGMA